MKGLSPFQSAQKKSEHNKSKELSPRTQYKKQQNEQLPQQVQYRLERVFQEAGHREERYITMIKEQQLKLKEQAQQYLQNLRQIKKEFTDFMSLKKQPNKKIQKVPLQQNVFSKKKEAARLNSKQFNVKTKLTIQKQSINDTIRVEPYLFCKIHFYYYTPFVSDYIRQVIPNEMILKMRSVYPNTQLSKQIKIVKDQDQYSNINSLIEKIPFQISTPQNTAIIIQFTIPCELEAINHYKKKQFQLQLINKNGMFVYAYSKINLSQMLYYQNHPTEWQIKPVSFYSVLDGNQVGQISLKLGNRLQLISKHQNYKIQSSTPMQVNKLKSSINYNDDESRMIQRISKFKTNTNSLLMGIGHSHEANAQRYFENQNDKIILMHRKKKELDSILQYKSSHKEEFMDKLFNQALNRYYLTQCQIGNPKYVIFNFLHKQRQHKQVFLKTLLNLREQNKPPKTSLLSIEKNIHVSIINPKEFGGLKQKQLIQISGQSHEDYDMVQLQDSSSMLVLSGMSHPVVLRIICFPPKQSLLTQQNLSATYDLSLKVFNDYDQQLQTFQTKIMLRQPSIEHKLYAHGYVQTQTELEILFDNTIETVVAKNLITNHKDLKYKWDQRWSRLSMQIEHRIIGQTIFYVIVNDSDHLYQISCYQVIVQTYPKLNHTIRHTLGEVQKIKLQFSFDEKTIADKYTSIDKFDISKSKTGKEQVRVLFASSKPEHCFVRCQNQTEIICKLNKIYEIQARLQSFSQNYNPQKIIIHAVDADTNTIIKRWLIEVQKQEKIKYQRVQKFSCFHGKPFKHKFQLQNTNTKQKSFRLYSSNLSIMTVPLSLISLISNQTTTVELELVVKNILSNQELLEPLKVILTVTDGTQFWNYLFKITVKIR